MPQGTKWDFIIDTIENEKCVLLLGPEICITKQGLPSEKALLEFLSIDQNENILTFYDQDGLFLFKDGGSKTKSYYEIKKFYQQEFVCDIYDKISKIPFHLIISITPDSLLQSMFEKNKIPFEFAYYDKTKKPDDVSSPSRKVPLIYNLLGSIDYEESLVLTHDDLFDFLLAILGSKNLPNNLLNSFQIADNLLFLGFKFDKWYVQVLLRLLNLHQSKYKFVRYASNKKINPDIQSLCVDQFKIEFVKDKCEEFIDNLYLQCEEKGLLRRIGESDKLTSQLVEKNIEEDHVDEAFTYLKSFFDKNGEQKLADTLVLLKARHTRLQRKITQKIIDEKDSEIEDNLIKRDIIDLNKEVKLIETSLE